LVLAFYPGLVTLEEMPILQHCMALPVLMTASQSVHIILIIHAISGPGMEILKSVWSSLSVTIQEKTVLIVLIKCKTKYIHKLINDFIELFLLSIA
jgi:hypothetical protein